MGKGAGGCGRPALAIGAPILAGPASTARSTSDVGDEIRSRLETDRQAYVALVGGDLCDDQVIVTHDGKRWSAWGSVGRGGIEAKLVQLLHRSGAEVRAGKPGGQGLRNGAVPGGKRLQLVVGGARVEYVPHGMLGWHDVDRPVWRVEELRPVEYVPPSYTAEELRVEGDTVWRLPDLPHQRRKRLAKLPVPEAEQIVGKTWTRGGRGFVQRRHQSEQARFRLMTDAALSGFDVPRGKDDDGAEALSRAVLAEFRNPSGTLKRAVAEWLDDYEPRSTRIVRRLPGGHKTPFSERGRLHVSAQQLDDCLVQLSACTGAAVLGTVDADRRLADHPSAVTPQLPRGARLWHSVCSAANEKEAVRQLASILDVGLLSGSERSRLGIAAKGLDPEGDKMQNIDWAVPTNIGLRPSYEGSAQIHLSISPTVLRRASLFHSDSTKWSWKDYMAYNKTIGHERFWQPCSPDATARHLKSVDKKSLGYNETWIGHVVRPDEIDAVIVPPAWAPAIQQRFPHLTVKTKV